MKWLPKLPRLPLLGKELTELAARRRTYVLRVVYALALFGCAGIYFGDVLAQGGSNPQNLFGKGRGMFDFLIGIQMLGVALFLPAIMAGVITSEKERDSLALLFLTDLKPWEIILQKYLGRLIPMFNFLLLSLPLMAMAYAFGGISFNHFFIGVYSLVLLCLEVGAMALMFSAFCRSTVTAFLATYFLGPILCWIIMVVLWFAWIFVLVAINSVMPLPYPFSNFSFADIGSVQFFFISPVVQFAYQFDLYLPPMPPLWWILFTVPNVILVLLFLFRARLYLIRRAFVLPRNVLLEFFKHLDRFMESANKSFGGIKFFDGKETLPGDKPVAWREVSKKSLGRIVYLMRIVVLIMVGDWIFTVAFLSFEQSLALGVLLLWGAAALAITSQATTMVINERMHQTLDVLLTTPLTGREILRQKMRRIYRLIYALAIPFGILCLTEAWWDKKLNLTGSPYLICSVLSVAVYLPMVAWIALWIGLKCRSRTRAIMTTLGTMVIWVMLPLAIISWANRVGFFRSFAAAGMDMPPEMNLLYFLSPMTIICANEFPKEWLYTNYTKEFLVVLLPNFIWYAAIFLFFRGLCLRNADRYLGRAFWSRRVAASLILPNEEVSVRG